MTIQEMKEKKKELGFSNAKLSELSGVPIGTLQKIFSGETTSPRYETIRALESVLDVNHYRHPFPQSDGVREAGVEYGSAVRTQGQYTLEDYYKLPDDQRVELIDGVFYDMAAPATVHQLLAGEIHRQIANYIIGKKGTCIPFISPVDVQLDCDEKTMLQPDVAIVCDRSKIIRRCIYGAPDFMLEVISPSTKRKDFTIKLSKYMNAGVREYWLVDPYKQMVFVYFFESETCCPGIYPIDDSIPVNIYEGDLQICLADMMGWIMEEAKGENPE